jgi:uroporphyrinogen decarboxylase
LPQSEKFLLNTLLGKPSDQPPFWLMRQAGRYLPEYRELRTSAKNFLDLCFSPDMAIEVTVQPLRRFGMDAAILFSDILVVPHALGQDVSFEIGRGPVLDPIRNGKQLETLSQDDVQKRLAPVYKTVSGVAATMPAGTTLIGFAGAPWTVATYMVEGGSSRNYEIIKNWTYSDPDGFQKLIDMVVEATSAYLIEQVRHGADVIQIFDTWAGVLSETAFERWCFDPIIKIVEQVKETCPDVPVIVFPRGVGIQYERFARHSLVDGVSLDTSVPLGWARDVLQPHCVVQGNLDPILLVTGGDGMVGEIKRILDILAPGPFIFNLGHGIVPETPPENVGLLTETIRGWKN